MKGIVHKIPIPLPVVVMKEGRLFVASCPVLDIATQGKTEEEVRENMDELIKEYLNDPDTPKPQIKAIMSITIGMTTVKVPEEMMYGKTQTIATKANC